jgi:acyl-CoA dehydrogenase
LRSYLLEDTWQSQDGTQDNPLARYNALLKDNERAAGIYKTVDKAYAKEELPMTALHPEQRFAAAHEAGLLSKEDLDFMTAYEAEVLDMLTVDDFAFDEFARNKSKIVWHGVQDKPKAKARSAKKAENKGTVEDDA